MNGAPNWDASGEHWPSAETSDGILGGWPGPVPDECLVVVKARLNRLREALHGAFVGLTDNDLGHFLDWLLAAAIARENVLLLGAPGVAKSEIATRFFHWLGLSSPGVPKNFAAADEDDPHEAHEKVEAYAKEERKKQKYFHYLLNRFTQPEELLGQIDISRLKQGILARVDWGLLTGPGVRGAFLDEVFKASSSILNALLTLMAERTYFNWGGMKPSDLAIVVGASNEMPGAFGGSGGLGAGGDDFSTLYAFVDRFPVRIVIPTVEGASSDEGESDLARAFAVAMGREGKKFSEGRQFGRPEEDRPIAFVNDLLALGRACFETARAGVKLDLVFGESLFEGSELERFTRAFVEISADLRTENTLPGLGRINWTISPRKMKALYKIALAHAVIRSDWLRRPDAKSVIGLGAQDLAVFRLIWDSPAARGVLEERLEGLMHEIWG